MRGYTVRTFNFIVRVKLEQTAIQQYDYCLLILNLSTKRQFLNNFEPFFITFVGSGKTRNIYNLYRENYPHITMSFSAKHLKNGK